MSALRTENRGMAVVTGASSGIGKMYAERLAKKGYDLLLVARRVDRLELIAKELTQQYGVSVKTQVADLANAADLEMVAKVLAGDDQITLLVNNAGTSFLGSLDIATVDQLHTLVDINIVALTRLAMAVLPGFKSRNQGAIVNIGSAVGFDGYPYTPIYGATKAYVQNLSRAMQVELSGTNVLVQLVAPAATVSEIWDVSGFALSNVDPELVMSTEDLVDAALVGLERKEKVTAPSVQDEVVVTKYLEAASELLGASQTANRLRVTSRSETPRGAERLASRLCVQWDESGLVTLRTDGCVSLRLALFFKEEYLWNTSHQMIG